MAMNNRSQANLRGRNLQLGGQRNSRLPQWILSVHIPPVTIKPRAFAPNGRVLTTAPRRPNLEDLAFGSLNNL